MARTKRHIMQSLQRQALAEVKEFRGWTQRDVKKYGATYKESIEWLARGADPMNPAFKERWLKALRSGKFAQGPGRLKQDKKQAMQDETPLHEPYTPKRTLHCCLGVLAAIDSKVEVGPVGVNSGDAAFHFALDDHRDMSTSTLPLWYADARYNLEQETLEVLMQLNDEGVRFTTIADLVEEYL